MDEPVRHSRFKLFMIGAVVVLAIGTGANLKAQQQDAHRRCMETAQRAAATGPALAKLVEAHRRDGDPNAARVWAEFQEAAKKNPVPKC